MDPRDSSLLAGAQVVLCDHERDPTAESDTLLPSLPLRETCPVLRWVGGLRLVGLGSDSDSDEEDVKEEHDRAVAPVGQNRSEDDLGPSRQWERVSIAEGERGEVAAAAAAVAAEEEEEEEEETVDGCPAGPAALILTVGADEDGSVLGSRSSHEEDEEWSELEYDDALVTLIRVVLGRGEWNVGDSDADSYIGEGDSEHENAFGQFVNGSIGSTPAAKSVVERLPVVLMTDEEATERNTFCAVCKDQILSAEMARQLPCSHIYHGGCILPWLEMKNTCPLCRYELPTKDSQWEN